LESSRERALAGVCLASGLDIATVALALTHTCPSKSPEWARKIAKKHTVEDAGKRAPVLLCLSGELQQVPLESLPCMQSQGVSRIPSMPFALVPSAARAPSLRMTFVVDPTDVLKRTQQALGERLEEMVALGLCEPGILGTSGPSDVPGTFQRYLEESRLVLYAGHGTGEAFVDPRRPEFEGATWAPVLLMGCSSASRKPTGVFEPNGKVLDAYLARSPLVVGTLWNVSDVDIDRFTVALLSEVKEAGATDILDAVASSRRACKLRMLVGAAPVCFGLPTTV
jgi:separase